MIKLWELKDTLLGVENKLFQERVRDIEVDLEDLLEESSLKGKIEAYENFEKLLNSLDSKVCPEFIKNKILKEII